MEDVGRPSHYQGRTGKWRIDNCRNNICRPRDPPSFVDPIAIHEQFPEDMCRVNQNDLRLSGCGSLAEGAWPHTMSHRDNFLRVSFFESRKDSRANGLVGNLLDHRVLPPEPVGCHQPMGDQKGTTIIQIMQCMMRFGVPCAAPHPANSTILTISDAWGSRGRRFKSCQPDKCEKGRPKAALFTFLWRETLYLRAGGPTLPRGPGRCAATCGGGSGDKSCQPNSFRLA